MENRHGLIVDDCVTKADGHAERTAALAMVETRADRLGRIRVRGRKRLDVTSLSVAACNLVRLPKLLAEPELA